MTCSEKVTIGSIKEIICAPIQLSKRTFIVNDFDRAWAQLQKSDLKVLQYMAKKEEVIKTTKGRFDPNDVKIPFEFVHKLLHQTDFHYYIEKALPFGVRGIPFFRFFFSV
jgi:hypothetical protein